MREYSANRWYVSPHNFSKEATSEFKLPKEMKVSIIDSTLREMETQPGVKLRISAEDIIETAKAADDLGVAEVYMHPHSYADRYTPSKFLSEWFKGYEAVVEQGFHFKLATIAGSIRSKERGGWQRLTDVVVEAEPDIIEYICFLPPVRSDVRYYHLTGTPLTVELAVEYMTEALEYAHSKGVKHVRLGVGDAGKIKFSDLIKLFNESIKNGAKSIMMYDATACFSPEGMRYFIKDIKKRLTKDVPLMVHVHESLGQATMVSAAAVTGGANGVDCAINGLEYRTGLTRLEEVVCVLEMLYGVSTGIRLERLCRYSKLVEKKTGVPVHQMQPITGENAWLFEHGALVQSELLDRIDGQRKALMPYAPEIVGNKTKLVWGANTLLSSAMETKLDEMKIEYTENDVGKILAIIEERLKTATYETHWLEESVIEEVINQYMKDKPA